MAPQVTLGLFSMGIGDRFCLEGRAQLRSMKKALELGVEVIPVWNKSNREHTIIGTEPASTRAEADEAVKAEGWKLPYFVDADHINLKTVDRFLSACDFFTLDVADYIGKPVSAEKEKQFIDELSHVLGSLRHPAFESDITLSRNDLELFARKYLFGLLEAVNIYNYLKEKKGEGNFITEVSVDEATQPQTPPELYLFLAGLAHYGVRVQTVAPKFTGEFLKGIDYVGNVNAFSHEFKSDIGVIDIAKEKFGLPAELKLSVHSGSDKFSLYPIIHQHLKTYNAGVHLKTAGTTWLEEVTGLAADAKGLKIAKKIYSQAYERIEELKKPYETVVSINTANLPLPSVVTSWNSDDFVSALKHDQKNPKMNKDFRQLVHISFRVAAEMGEEYITALKAARQTIEAHVTDNLYERHILPLFIGK